MTIDKPAGLGRTEPSRAAEPVRPGGPEPVRRAPSDTEVRATGSPGGEAPGGAEKRILRLDAPFCGYCGKPEVRLSTRGGFRENLLRLLDASLYRCQACGRRFGFAVVGHPNRHHRGQPGYTGRHRSEHHAARRLRTNDRRRRVVTVLWTVGAALLSFLAAAYVINLQERRTLEEQRQIPLPRRS